MKKLLILLLLPLFTFGQKECVVSVTTDSYPSETYWVLFADSLYGDTIANVTPGYYTSSNTNHLDTCYIADTITTVVFLMKDTYGDGMSGSYYVVVCEDTIVNKPTVSFSSGLYSTRTVPQCMPNPPPPPPGVCVPAMVNINLDQFQSETTWDIKDTNGTVLFSGGPYTNAPDYEPQFIPICIDKGNFEFTIYDSYGDGLNGSLWGGNDGSYYVMQCGDTLVYGTVPNFGTDSTHAFTSDSCTPPPPIPGCMDDSYLEYNPSATVTDSSCATLKIHGCTDSTMFNYDSTANTMDYIDSCNYTLILHDLVGNGWVGSKLEIYQDDTTEFIMTGGFNQIYAIQLNAPKLVKAKFFVSAQASNTALECGFTLVNPMGDTVLSVAPPFMQPFFTYAGTTYCGNECIEIVEGCMDSTAFNYDSLANTSETCYYVPGCISPAYLEYHIDTSNGVYTDFNIQDSCNTLVAFGCTDSIAYNYDSTANVDNGGCVPIVLGCMQPLAFNYNVNANTPDVCIAIVYGCMSSIATNYNPSANTDDGSCIGVVLGCTDSTMWNYSPSANTSDNSCLPYVYGCMDPTMFNYNQLANTDNGSCIPFAYGCTDSTMFNYDPLANTDNNSCTPYIYGCTNPTALNYCDSCNVDDFSCILPTYGCMDSLAFNYNPLANVDNGSCVSIIYGCTDPVALNYCDSCNTDDFSCILPIYGCTDSVMFNYNPLANVDNNSCVPYVYGCTDPSMLNYDPTANTEDFSCISYVYGCTDSSAINYDSTANTENGSCVAIVEGCMDPNAYNYNHEANVSDNSCNYDAGCVTGPGSPYWLNNPCYAWVIDIDNYCCENEWDTICQATYNYCEGTWIGPLPKRFNKKLIAITDILGRPITKYNKQLLLYIYNDGTVEKKYME